MDNELGMILIKFGGPSTSDMLTMLNKVILLIFPLASTSRARFAIKKTLCARITGVRVDFLGPLGCPAMEKNNKSYKYYG